MEPKVLAIIPARGGSKGFPGKNSALLRHAPLLAWSIAAGLESKVVNRVILSTDSIELANIGSIWGAEVPFLRPNDISGDQATDVSFLQHALNFFREQEHWLADYVVLLRPTSPLRPKGMIDQCFNKLINNPQADSLRIVTDAPQTPYKMWWQNDDYLAPILAPPLGIPEPFNSPRQLLPKAFWQIGTLDIIKSSTILTKHSASGNKIIGHYLSPDYAVDIDRPEDLFMAEKQLSLLPDCIYPKSA